MAASQLRLVSLVFAAVAIFASNSAWGIGFELGETKEQLKLKYDVSWIDHHTGSVTIHLTLSDEGRLGPLRSVELFVSSEKEPGRYDLSARLGPREEDGKKVFTVQLTRELAERAAIHLVTDRMDGKSLPMTWYYHRIPVAATMTADAQIPNPPRSTTNPDSDGAAPPPATPSP